MTLISPFTPFFCSLLFFCIDSALFFLYELQPLYLLLAYFIVLLFSEINRFQAAFILFLLSLESFLFFNQFGISLLYLVPLTILSWRIQHTLYLNRAYLILFALGCTLIQVYGLEKALLGLSVPPEYTVSKICGTLVVVGILSLKIHIKHNRTTAYS